MALTFPIRLYNPGAALKVAVLSVQPSTKHPGQRLLQVAKGVNRKSLNDVQLLGPFTDEAFEPAVEGVLKTLQAQGYRASGAFGSLATLDDAKPRKRALAALSLAWRAESAAVPKLIEVVGRGKQDVSTAVDALGLLRDVRGVPAVRAEAERKLLSRRRSGAEALRSIGDAEGLAGVRTRALERLEEPLRKALAAQNDAVSSQAGQAALIAAFDTLGAGDRGVALDTLYELGTPLCVDTVRALLSRFIASPDTFKRLAAPNLWRYVKSIWKRSMLRFDADTFGPLSVAIERLGRTTKGQRTKLKSGLDGETRETAVFSKRTVRHLRGRAWRYLKRLATYKPEAFVDAGVAVLAAYQPEDDGIPKGNVGASGRLYLLHRVLFGRSARFSLDWRTLNHRLKSAKSASAPAGLREEAFPELWDARPVGYLKLLAHGQRDDVLGFAVSALKGRAASVMKQAAHADIVALLDSRLAEVVGLALEELVRRFDASAPDFGLLESLGAHPSERARGLATQWLTRTLALWAPQPKLVLRYLTRVHPQVSVSLAPVVGPALASLEVSARAELATGLLAFVRAPEGSDGAHAGAAQVLREALLAETSTALGLQGALDLLLSPSVSASALGAAVLSGLPQALETLGWPRIAAMARSEKVALRTAALGLIKAHATALEQKPSLLFELVESDWDDVRAVALAILSPLTFEALTFDGLVALLDSPRLDVQQSALAMLERHLGALDTQLLLTRLSQHPGRSMRGTVLRLLEQHLKPGFVQLAKAEPMLRSILFEASAPSRPLKQRTIAFLEARGAQDAEQAALAARILTDVVRTQTRADRDRLLQALVRLRLAFPEAHVLGAPQLQGLPS